MCRWSGTRTRSTIAWSNRVPMAKSKGSKDGKTSKSNKGSKASSTANIGFEAKL
jgi:hypothetical protein